MEAPTAPGTPGGGGIRGGYRGRGGGLPMRGSFDRGRGRGIRGHYMGGMGRGGIPGMGGIPPPHGMMLGGRGMRMPRGGPGYQGRGGFIPRGGPMRGGRPPLYVPHVKQHTGADNNKTVSPVPSATGAGGTAASADETETVTTVATTGASDENNSVAPHASNGNVGGGPIHSRGPRGRGSSFIRTGGRGGYNPYTNGMHSSMGGHLSTEHGQMTMRRGGPPRGRGSYGQSLTRAPMHHQHQHSANTQIAPVPSLKRGAPGMLPGPKRGRYEGGPYSQRPMTPKYHHAPQHAAAMTAQSSYGAPPSHHQQPQSHHSYAAHEQSQVVDPYAQSYAAPAAQSTYNGYGSGSYAPAAQQSTSSSYAHHSSEYDQSQYQNYGSTAYSTQDTRYQTYGQDYTQQYGAPAVDYNSASQVDYAQPQHSQQAYDERAYAGYDSQNYQQQSYANTTGYY